MKQRPDLLLAVYRDPSVDVQKRAAAEAELGRRLEEAKRMIFRGDPGGVDAVFNSLNDHLHRLPHPDPRDQARALRGLARTVELSLPGSAIALYREALGLYPRIQNVKDRLEVLEAAVARVRRGATASFGNADNR